MGKMQIEQEQELAVQQLKYDTKLAKADSLIEQINEDHKKKVQNLNDQIQVFKT